MIGRWGLERAIAAKPIAAKQIAGKPIAGKPIAAKAIAAKATALNKAIQPASAMAFRPCRQSGRARSC